MTSCYYLNHILPDVSVHHLISLVPTYAQPRKPPDEHEHHAPLTHYKGQHALRPSGDGASEDRPLVSS